jgi:hypothetical protein
MFFTDIENLLILLYIAVGIYLAHRAYKSTPKSRLWIALVSLFLSNEGVVSFLVLERVNVEKTCH